MSNIYLLCIQKIKEERKKVYMGAFAIFASIVTFIFVVYFAVMMAMDASGGRKTTKYDVEVISTGGVSIGDKRESIDEDSKPTVVSEGEDGSFSIDEEGDLSKAQAVSSDNGYDQKSEAPLGDTTGSAVQPHDINTPEDVLRASDSDLLASTEEAEQESTPINVTIEGAVTVSNELEAALDDLDASYDLDLGEDEL